MSVDYTDAAKIIAAHRQVGPTKFSHHGGLSYVEYPKCGCGEQMHPNVHARHVADALAAAGCLTQGIGVNDGESNDSNAGHLRAPLHNP